MRKRLAAALLLIVTVPLIALIGLGTKVVRDERALRADRMDELLAARLDDLDGLAMRVLEDRRQELRQALGEVSGDVSAIRHLPRKLPFIRQTFIRDAEGSFVYPSPRDPITDDERDFLRRTRALWQDRDTLGDASEAPAQAAPAQAAPAQAAPAPAVYDGGTGDDGWYAWFWDSGLQLLYWRSAPDGRIVGAELGRVQLLSDLIAVLPVTDPLDEAATSDRIVLLDARAEPVYQWGLYEPAAGEAPRARRSLSPPLGAWTLSYFVSDAGMEAAAASGSALALTAGLLALGLVLAGLGLYFHRESSREIREASERVGFVNQVSHELKTPLTNIRMYAELLQRRVDPEDDRAQRHLGIIVAESQRLSRLIGNVLTFARHRRDALVLRPAPGCVDETLDEVLAQFRPALETRGVEVRFEGGAPGTRRFDADVVTQVVANLISNVEKYAAGGGQLHLTTSADGTTATVTVADRGPGIPGAEADAVFQPFVRLDDALTEGVSGAGIGLALARELARLHGGDLVLRPADRGATFVFTFRAEEAP